MWTMYDRRSPSSAAAAAAVAHASSKRLMARNMIADVRSSRPQLKRAELRRLSSELPLLMHQQRSGVRVSEWMTRVESTRRRVAGAVVW